MIPMIRIKGRGRGTEGEREGCRWKGEEKNKGVE